MRGSILRAVFEVGVMITAGYAAGRVIGKTNVWVADEDEVKRRSLLNSHGEAGLLGAAAGVTVACLFLNAALKE